MKFVTIKVDKKQAASFRKLWNTLISARPFFNRLPNKSTEMKRLAIEACIPDHYEDALIFWTDFRKATKRLLRNIEFLRECEMCGRNPVHVAEHVVFLGSGVVDAVGDDGLSVLQGQEILYIDPICTEETLKVLAGKNTYEKYVHISDRHYDAPNNSYNLPQGGKDVSQSLESTEQVALA